MGFGKAIVGIQYLRFHMHEVIAPVFNRFLFKAKKAALISPPPVVPTMPRLVEDVVPDDRDDVDIILNTTTV